MHEQSSTAGIAAFASVAPRYEAWFASPLGAFVDRREMQALAHILRGGTAGSVVDIGAGTGHVTTFLARRGHRMTAVEPAPAMRYAGRRHTMGLPIRWCAAQAESLPFVDASFDGAVCFTTLEFVHDPVRAMQEALRVLRPAGWLVVGFLHAWSSWAAWYRYQADRGVMPWAAAQFFTRDDIEQCVGQPATASAAAVFLAPRAAGPFDDADRAGRRAGNYPALEILCWRKPV